MNRIDRNQNATLASVSIDTAVAFRIFYRGTATPTLTVDSSSDITFLEDAVADASISTDGKIDVSGGSEDTLGEIQDIVNADANWYMVLVAGLRGDVVSSNQIKPSQYTAEAVPKQGLPVYFDTGNFKQFRACFGQEAIETAHAADMLAAAKQSAGNLFAYRDAPSGYAASAIPNIITPNVTTAIRRSSRNGALKWVQAIVNGSGTIEIYEAGQTTASEVLLTTLNGSASIQPSDISEGNNWWEASEGKRIVVSAKDSTNAITTGNFNAAGCVKTSPGQVVS